MSDFIQALIIFGIVTIAIVAITHDKKFKTKVNEDGSAEIAVDKDISIDDKKEK